MEDLKPMDVGPFVRDLDQPTNSDVRCFAPEGGLMPHRAAHHPVSREEARKVCLDLIDKTRDRTFLQLRSAWWAYLREAATPEGRLSAERMIDAINMAWGMNCADEVIQMRAAREAEDQAARARAKLNAEAEAVSRWADFRGDA